MYEFSSKIDIEYLTNIIFEAFKLPIMFVDKDNKISLNLTYNNSFGLNLYNVNDILEEFLPLDTSSSTPVFKSNKYMENYICINLITEDKYIGTFFMGPSLYSSITPLTIDEIIFQNSLPLKMKQQLINHFSSLPIIEYSQLVSISLIIYYLIYQQKLDTVELRKQNSILKNPIKIIEENLFSNLSSNRKNSFFHHSKKAEDNLMKCVKDGDTDRIKYYLETPFDGEMGTLSKKSALQSEKNLAVCCTTLATRAAIEGGLSSELAYTLSDSYIQLIDEFKDIKDLSNLRNSILLDFAQKVKECKENKHSKAVTLCEKHIFNNLYEDITLKSISDNVNFNQNYISTIFRKETGMTITQYIHKKRIDESKFLLTSTDYSILEISILLKFHDQSHFTKIFKRFTGLSPKKYRELL